MSNGGYTNLQWSPMKLRLRGERVGRSNWTWYGRRNPKMRHSEVIDGSPDKVEIRLNYSSTSSDHWGIHLIVRLRKWFPTLWIFQRRETLRLVVAGEINKAEIDDWGSARNRHEKEGAFCPDWRSVPGTKWTNPKYPLRGSMRRRDRQAVMACEGTIYIVKTVLNPYLAMRIAE